MSNAKISAAANLQAGPNPGIEAPIAPTMPDRREFIAVLAALMPQGLPAAQPRNISGMPINNAGPSQPQLTTPPVCERITKPQVAAVLLGISPSPCPPEIRIQRVEISSTDFSNIKNKGTPYAITPSNSRRFTIPSETRLLGSLGAITAFNIPDPNSPDATQKRIKFRSAQTHTFVMLAEIVEGMKAYRSQNPEAASCEVVIGRSTDNFKGPDTVVYRSIPFDLKSTPEAIETRLKTMIAGLQKDREDWEKTGQHTDAGRRASELAEKDQIFYSLYRVASVIDLRITSESITRAGASKFEVQGVVTGNSGNGKNNQTYAPSFAIVAPGLCEKVERALSNSENLSARQRSKIR